MPFGKFRPRKLVTNHQVLFNPTPTQPSVSFKCPVCSSVVLQLSSFILHVGSHGEKLHIGVSTPQKLFKCDICETTCSQKSVLARHMQSHILFRQPQASTCDSCGLDFADESEMKSHSEVQHRKLRIKCRVCKENCVTWELRKLHELVMHFLKGFDCLKCRLRITSLKVKRHFRKHPGLPETCCFCQRTFNSARLCRLHKLKVHLETPSGPVLCDICGKNLSSKVSLKRHMKVHLGKELERSNWYQCDLCQKRIKTFEALENHLKHHLSPLTCQLCLKTFTKKGTLASHLKSHRIYSCSTCSLTFKRRSLLVEHEKIHEPFKTHQCPEPSCKKSFAQLAGLYQHLRSHQKPSLVCKVCGRAFKHPPTFYEHRKSHSQTPEWRCPTCDKTCPSRFALYIHKKTHLNVTHTCEGCGKNFKWKNSLKQHFLKHHNVP